MQFKKLLLVILSSSLILFGCGNDDDDSGTTGGIDVPTGNDPNPEPNRALTNGTWGSDQIELNISSSSIHFHLNCGEGTVRGRIRPDENGNFRNRGTVTYPDFETAEDDSDETTYPVVLRGSVNGNKTVMALTIEYDFGDDADEYSENYVLRKGVQGPEDGQCEMEEEIPEGGR